MIERNRFLDIVSHAVLILGVLVVAFPVYVTFVASTHTMEEVVKAPMSLWPGSHLIENYKAALLGDRIGMGSTASTESFWRSSGDLSTATWASFSCFTMSAGASCV